MIITGETDAEAKAKWDLYKAAPTTRRCAG